MISSKSTPLYFALLFSLSTNHAYSADDGDETRSGAGGPHLILTLKNKPSDDKTEHPETRALGEGPSERAPAAAAHSAAVDISFNQEDLSAPAETNVSASTVAEEDPIHDLEALVRTTRSYRQAAQARVQRFIHRNEKRKARNGLLSNEESSDSDAVPAVPAHSISSSEERESIEDPTAYLAHLEIQQAQELELLENAQASIERLKEKEQAQKARLRAKAAQREESEAARARKAARRAARGRIGEAISWDVSNLKKAWKAAKAPNQAGINNPKRT